MSVIEKWRKATSTHDVVIQTASGTLSVSALIDELEAASAHKPAPFPSPRPVLMPCGHPTAARAEDGRCQWCEDVDIARHYNRPRVRRDANGFTTIDDSPPSPRPRPVLIRGGRRYLDVSDLGTDERRVLERIASKGGYWYYTSPANELVLYRATMTEHGLDVTDIGRHEVERLELLAGRLALGQQRYGLLCLATDGRDWRKEALEEDLDGEIYRTCEEISKEGIR